MSKQDKSHEMLVMWMELNRAIVAVKRSQKLDAAVEVIPWACLNEDVKIVWEKITSPENLGELKERLRAASREQKRLWTEKAIQECKRRLARKRRPSGSG